LSIISCDIHGFRGCEPVGLPNVADATAVTVSLTFFRVSWVIFGIK